MFKNILALIGAVTLVAVIGAFALFGGKVQQLDGGALPAYMKMFGNILENGDAARAMMKEWKISDEVTNDDAAELIKALAEEYNMRITGDVKMYTKDDATADEIKHARIFSLCSLPIAKVFLNYSRWYGGFMPCRIMLVEYGSGERFLVAMDMTLAIHGGHPLPDDMLKMALSVKKAMEEIPERVAKGDF
ncbi:DUF302 domain-containing protein [Thiomicrolovo sp. ZZH C-3]